MEVGVDTPWIYPWQLLNFCQRHLIQQDISHGGAENRIHICFHSLADCLVAGKNCGIPQHGALNTQIHGLPGGVQQVKLGIKLVVEISVSVIQIDRNGLVEPLTDDGSHT